jgi:hypothetical protein
MCSPTMRPNHALQRTRRKRRAAERTGYAERCTSRFSRWVLLNGAMFTEADCGLPVAACPSNSVQETLESSAGVLARPCKETQRVLVVSSS